MKQFLAESEKCKVISLDENVYLKVKNKNKNLVEYTTDDVFIGHHYGNPSGALIIESKKTKLIITAGCGISIYNINTKESLHLFSEPDEILWTEAIHQSESDIYDNEFRFISYDTKNELTVYKMSIETLTYKKVMK